MTKSSNGREDRFAHVIALKVNFGDHAEWGEKVAMTEEIAVVDIDGQLWSVEPEEVINEVLDND